ncbi:MAG TPA: DUF1080 domain-containing protein [Polyangiaceae bacterium LLY-WYZ-15_(1-7)]|nr:hypothetical protein [Myxococcales bacterium]MAT28497.1 hypothetical protein [Sandaracinus sp.]HJL04166.1 DUF1080 domain-containing protein [Polyangiaceae bacterium LLY-WYZ-15_(1-7)]MBJ71843.1 hypothetical protein [Sandaracinus sp.]HJL10404.1 DUF1080 domain-containing protein [Polyangiaceae bacterium LLY-WYZ-15_(1-7)]
MRHLIVLAALAALACTPQGDPAVPSEGYSDDFERDRLGDDWNNTGGPWEIRDGWLHVRGARNRPLWLRRVLPRDVRVEFDVKSMSDEGDIKVEVFGDGSSRATSESYTATSYVIIMGGWGNSTNIIARMDEHGADRAVGPRRPVEPGRVYHFRIEREGDRITAWVDDEELASMEDDEPLEGRGHDHFAFNNWQSDLWFDNLEITPL